MKRRPPLTSVVAKYKTANAKSVVEKVTNALLSKAAALLVQGQNLPEGDFTLLLDSLAKERRLRPGFIQALTQLAAVFGVSRALELIENSQAADLLLPARHCSATGTWSGDSRRQGSARGGERR